MYIEVEGVFLMNRQGALPFIALPEKRRCTEREKMTGNVALPVPLLVRVF